MVVRNGKHRLAGFVELGSFYDDMQKLHLESVLSWAKVEVFMYMAVIFFFPLFLVLVLIVFLWSSLCLVVTTFWRLALFSSTYSPEGGETPKRHDNKTQRRPQEHKQDKSGKEKITTMYAKTSR